METWAHCVSCRRWYYCGASLADADAPRCPVCCAPPSVVEERPAAEYADITVEHFGVAVDLRTAPADLPTSDLVTPGA